MKIVRLCLPDALHYEIVWYPDCDTTVYLPSDECEHKPQPWGLCDRVKPSPN